MVKASKKQLQLSIENLFKELGLKLTESDLVSSLNYEAPSRIGTFYTGFRIDKDTVWLFGNFLGNEEAAKKEFGHWKRNLMIDRGQLSVDNILGRIEVYLTFIR